MFLLHVVVAVAVFSSFIEFIARMYFTSNIVSEKSQTCCSKSHSSFVLFETLVIVAMSRLFASCLQSMCMCQVFFCCCCCSLRFVFHYYSNESHRLYCVTCNVTVNAKKYSQLISSVCSKINMSHDDKKT